MADRVQAGGADRGCGCGCGTKSALEKAWKFDRNCDGNACGMLDNPINVRHKTSALCFRRDIFCEVIEHRLISMGCAK
jgi:hypothetical protein